MSKARKSSSSIPAPPADSSLGITMSYVVGSKSDTHDGDSLMAKIGMLEEHAHNGQGVYPTLAAGVDVTANGSAWTLGDFVEIIPASTVTSDFDIHHISVEGLDTSAVYELVIYYGASDTEYGRARFVKNAAQDGTVSVPIQGPIVAGNSKIRAKVADSVGGSVATVSLFYHTY